MSANINENVISDMIDIYKATLENATEVGNKFIKNIKVLINLLEITQTTIDGVFEKGWDGSGVIEKCKEM